VKLNPKFKIQNPKLYGGDMKNRVHQKMYDVLNEIKKMVIGQDKVLYEILLGFFSGGHILLEGVPGIAKTLIAKTIAYICDLEFKRIQFTPDLMPSDILGTSVFDIKEKIFTFVKGPVFTDILLADEINRTPPKTQSALLEAMQEKQVSIEGNMYKLPDTFFVIATQNPIEYEGTYPLPEAQIDRFIMKVNINYPQIDDEIDILKKHKDNFDIFESKKAELHSVLSRDDIMSIKKQIRDVKVEESIYKYIYEIIDKTRKSPRVSLGASTRAGICLLLTGKVNALFESRDYIIPDDIKKLALPVLRHRLILKPEAEMESIFTDNVIEEILSEIEVPR
jgi:MoxR-like ATPase